MDTKICRECGTENENDYVYCKNCGIKLENKPQSVKETKPYVNTQQAPEFIDAVAEPSPDTAPEPPINPHVQQDNGGVNNAPPYTQQYNAGGNTYNQNPYYNYSIEGIPADDVACFVGKKANEILPKFMKMEVTQTKTSWCWPAAVFGFLFGPIGAALWFFYRKMYKIALLLLAVGAVVTVTTSAMTYNTNSKTINDIFNSVFGENSGSLLDALEGINSDKTVLDVAADALNSSAQIATCILAGLFGYYAYKNNCIRKIRAFRQNCFDQRYYRLGLASIGGVSSGMLAVGIVSFIVINNMAAMVTFLLSLI